VRSAGEQEASNDNLAATKIGKAIRKNAYQIAAEDCNPAWPQPKRAGARLERMTVVCAKILLYEKMPT